MSRVQDAIILAGGTGTRMLPASLYSPKETMALVDTPILNHLIWEAAKAGVSRIHIVLSERKMRILEQFFERGSIHDEKIRDDLPRHALSLGVKGVEIIPHIQNEPGGVADAISVAIPETKGPFLVILGDMIILDKHISPREMGVKNASDASLNLVSVFESEGLPCVGVYPVETDKLSKYGVVEFSGNNIVGIAEKPSEIEGDGGYVLCGRYIFPEKSAEILGRFPQSIYGEMQSIELLNFLIENGGLRGVRLDHMQMYDSGEPLSWLISQIDHAIRREDTGSELIDWVRERIGKHPPEL